MPGLTETEPLLYSLLFYGLLVGLIAGALAGTLAGLAGVGGGLIYVPVFYAFLPAQDGGMALHIFASMLAIVMTGFFSARSHWRLGHIDKPLLLQLLPGLMVGAGLGLWSTLHLPAALILLALAALDGWVARDYGSTPVIVAGNRPSPALFSGPIGYISGALGIGGGTMIVPLLRRHLPLRAAVGTSAACTLLMALAATSLNLIAEPGWPDLLHEQWPSLLGIGLGIAAVLPFCSRWSANLHALLPEPVLRITLRSIFIALSACLLLAASLALLQS